MRAIPAPGAGAQPRSWFDKLNEWARAEGAPGLGYITLEEEGGKVVGRGPIAKFIPAAAIEQIATRAACKAGDAVFFAADKAPARSSNRLTPHDGTHAISVPRLASAVG